MQTITITSASMLSDEDGVVDKSARKMKNSKGGEMRGGDPARAEENGHTDEKKNADRKTSPAKTKEERRANAHANEHKHGQRGPL